MDPIKLKPISSQAPSKASPVQGANIVINNTTIVSADWDTENSNDSSYIKNKPFGIVTKSITLSDLVFNGSGSIYSAMKTLEDSFEFVAGENYTVTIGGESKTLTAFNFNVYNIIGNGDLIPALSGLGDNSVNYLIMIYDDYVAIYSSVSNITEIKISGHIVNRLDTKFIPPLDYATREELYEYTHRSLFDSVVGIVKYKGFNYSSGYRNFLWIVSTSGLWRLHWTTPELIFSQYRTAKGVKVDINSTTGLITATKNGGYECSDYALKFTAYRYDTNTGKIVERHEDVTEVTIGKIDKSKMSHNMPLFIDNVQESSNQYSFDFDDYTDPSNYYTKAEIDALINSLKN